MNEIENQGVEYTDDNLVSMVEEDQDAVEQAAGGADADFVADTVAGANPEGIVEDDAEVIPDGGREGAAPMSLGTNGRPVKDVTPKGMSGKVKAGLGIAGAAAAATAAGAALTKKKKNQAEDRKGARMGEGEEMEETVESAPVETTVVDHSDPVSANYASIQAAVGYAMQDHRL